MSNRAGKTSVAMLAVCLLATTVAASADVTVDLEWIPTTQTVQLGDTVGVQLWAFPSEPVDFNSAQAIITWDTTYLQLDGVDDPAYPPPPDESIWSSSFPVGDSFGLNETDPLPQDGNGLWVGEVAVGETLNVGTEGLLLTTILFDTLAETPGTPVTIQPELQLAGHPTARTKFNVGTYNVLGDVGEPTIVTIVPEPASLLSILLLGSLGAWRRR